MEKRKATNSSLLSYFHKKQKPLEERHASETWTSDIQQEHLLKVPENSPSQEKEVSPAQSTPIQPEERFSALNDIGDFVQYIQRCQITSDMRKSFINDLWIPDASFKFPKTGKRNLRFNFSWLSRWKWLAYSKISNGAFCKHCVLFSGECGAGRGHQFLGKLVKQKFDNWKKAVEEFDHHEATQYHKLCVLKAANFSVISSGSQSSIEEQIDSNVTKKIEENRRRLTPIISTIILCGRQGLPLRGHRDHGTLDINQEPTENDGNFRALLRFRVESGDSHLQNHLDTAGRNSTYLSPQIQNEIISSCNVFIVKQLVSKINTSQSFSILADETTDVSGQEQLSLSVRYLEKRNEKNCTNEDFLQFTPIVDLTGKGLSSKILEKLVSLGVDMTHVRGQGYDGASAMRGDDSGVQAFIKKLFPLATYVHCSSHCLNLAITDACNVQSIRNAMGTLGVICNFFCCSAKRRHLLSSKINEVLPHARATRLVKLCPTRWVERHDSVLVFVELLPAIFQALDEIATTWKDKSVLTEANCLLCAVSEVEFLVAIICLYKILSVSVRLSEFLQTENLDLVEAMAYAENVQDVIADMRTRADETFHQIFLQVQNICEQQEIQVTLPRCCKKQLNRTNIPLDAPEDYFRASVYVPFLDSFLLQIQERLLKNKSLLQSFACLLPVSRASAGPSSQQEEEMRKLYQTYCTVLDCGEETALGELKLWYRHLASLSEDVRPESALSSLDICENGFFPTIRVLLKALCVLPISNATSERSFSTLRRLKSYMRNRMGEERLNGLTLLNIHRDIKVTPNDILNELAKTPRRLDLRVV